MQSLKNRQTLEQFFEPLYVWPNLQNVQWSIIARKSRDCHGLPTGKQQFFLNGHVALAWLNFLQFFFHEIY